MVVESMSNDTNTIKTEVRIFFISSRMSIIRFLSESVVSSPTWFQFFSSSSVYARFVFLV